MSLAEKLELQRQAVILQREKVALYQQLAKEAERLYRVTLAQAQETEAKLNAAQAEPEG